VEEPADLLGPLAHVQEAVVTFRWLLEHVRSDTRARVVD
jgi:hypothetical protein